MAPGGHRLHVDVVADKVAWWFTAVPGDERKEGEAWLVPEWDGTHLQNLVREIVQCR